MIRKMVLAAVAAFAIAGCAKNDDPTPADYDNLIVYGNIYTAKVDASKGKTDTGRYIMADAMVVKDGKFAYVGTRTEADKFKTDKSLVIDRTGKGIIIPGITDGHAHYMMKFINELMKDQTILFNSEQSYDDVIRQVREFVESARKDGRQLDYVYGDGYSISTLMQDGFDPRHRKDL
ncbi:MAG: hypothetical protein KBS36_01190, partial [Bacteroidales bacterium]|nr:hypothetical protein [Candidatus Cryptobacteroides fimicaballi]